LIEKEMHCIYDTFFISKLSLLFLDDGKKAKCLPLALMEAASHLVFFYEMGYSGQQEQCWQKKPNLSAPKSSKRK
jgi:hypothetical protein